MAQWRILDFQKFEGSIAAKTGRLYAGGRSVPLSDISAILTGPRCSLHASLLDRAAEFQISILACDWRGIPYSVVLPWSSNTRIGARHIAQAELSEGRRKNAWMQIVKAKIAGQRTNLGDHPMAKRLLTLHNEVRSGDPANNEAQAARFYWPAVFPDDPDFERTSHINSGRNALLNYGYTILRGHLIRHIVAAGLWPTLGLWHRNRSNVFALADDLIEPFRPAVDFIVQGMPPSTQVIDPGVREQLVAVTELPFGLKGFTVSTQTQKVSQDFAKYVEGDNKIFKVKSWQIAD